jgi:GMP synthase-like glutamine amidotransferase
MRMHYLQHAPFESPGIILSWAKKKGITVSSTMLYENQALPAMQDFDLLVIMGGPMGVHDEAQYGFMKPEKKFIEESLKSGKKMAGFCLGAQMIADVLGAAVKKNGFKEIGWYRIRFTPEAVKNVKLGHFPSETTVFHWHGDTFDIPSGALRMASSDACANQGFMLNDRVFAFQFHPEVDEKTIRGFIGNDTGELVKDRFVQTGDEILSGLDNAESVNKCLEEFLEKF